MRIVHLSFGVVMLAMSQTPGSFDGNIILGRPTDHSITASVMSAGGLEAYLEFGVAGGRYTNQTAAATLPPGRPAEFVLEKLRPNTRYYYRLRYRRAREARYAEGDENSFETQRSPGSIFTFGVQGDSHPERGNSMYHPDLYRRTLENVRHARPDFKRNSRHPGLSALRRRRVSVGHYRFGP